MKEIAKKVNLLEPIDLDKISIKKDHYFADAYIIDLPIDSAPDHVWQDIFEREWKSSRHLWDRKLFVIADRLRLVTSVSDIDEKLNWVKQVVEKTNRSVEEYNKEAEAREVLVGERLKKHTVEEEGRVEEIKDVMRKRFRTV
jgi:hypothetical protein